MKYILSNGSVKEIYFCCLGLFVSSLTYYQLCFCKMDCNEVSLNKFVVYILAQRILNTSVDVRSSFTYVHTVSYLLAHAFN